jgi:5-methylcytosine-specific restriction protein B
MDRDHCLGHAYFITLKDDDPIEELAFIFRQKILPLLQEYFFEDWERIAWVLNDHKKPDGQQFVQKTPSNLEYLFGKNFSGNLQDRRWRINQEAFFNIDSYRGIIGVAE